ncbi:phosphomannomutase [Pseudoalteromonas rubra]|uniref:Phosphomannomutase n=1 Tax=Pseudoalteromonas rubra TaxID=43658 RepID=A0A5S3UWU6_9GAMM|nr:phosphomannomutase [Pseudoalteromonas rubra]QPB84235.1 phosphomannomutase [Pseudoalteromonas rubra]
MTTANCTEIIAQSGIQFGTSGARGLNDGFTAQVCQAFMVAMIAQLKPRYGFSGVVVGMDNRPSSPKIAQYCVSALHALGVTVQFAGVLPTPALALYAQRSKRAAVMVTGSHIPFDRNGLKFYHPYGEIDKADEAAIVACQAVPSPMNIQPLPDPDHKISLPYLSRMLDVFPADLCVGKTIGVYQHTSAGRDLYVAVLEALGAKVICLGRSSEFVPIDTEAVSEQDKSLARQWTREHHLDLLFSTDGDGDRPMIADHSGHWLRGDILGLLCAKALDIEALSVPLNCNTSLELCGEFKQVRRTRIGSPYVIEQLTHLADIYPTVAGFEANGGFLLGTDIMINGKVIERLPTRDALLPLLAILYLVKQRGTTLAQLTRQYAVRYTASDRLQGVTRASSDSLLAILQTQPQRLADVLKCDCVPTVASTLDGVRFLLDDDCVVHLRQSGNAPELRCYTEASSQQQAGELVRTLLGALAQQLSTPAPGS